MCVIAPAFQTGTEEQNQNPQSSATSQSLKSPTVDPKCFHGSREEGHQLACHSQALSSGLTMGPQMRGKLGHLPQGEPVPLQG